MKESNILELSNILNLKERRIQLLAEEGVITRNKHGIYDIEKSTASYIKYLQKLSSGGHPTPQGEKDAKTRWTEAKAAKAELELDIMQGKYMETSEIEFLWGNMVINFRNKMLGIPNKLVMPIIAAGVDAAKIASILENEIYDALTELSKADNDKSEQNSNCNNPETSPTTKVKGK